jgi:hypothetical protein
VLKGAPIMETQMSSHTVVRMVKDPPKLPHSDQLQTTSARQVCAFLPWNQSASYNVRQLFIIGGTRTECWGPFKVSNCFWVIYGNSHQPWAGPILGMNHSNGLFFHQKFDSTCSYSITPPFPLFFLWSNPK